MYIGILKKLYNIGKTVKAVTIIDHSKNGKKTVQCKENEKNEKCHLHWKIFGP